MIKKTKIETPDTLESNEEEKVLTFADLEPAKEIKSNRDVQRDALKLVRCIVTCNNKNKTSYTGEIFSASNSMIPEVKKFVQFGSPYHVPQIILNVIKDKKMNVFHKQRKPDGNFVTVSKEVPEYSIQLLDPISQEEFEAIKKKQLAEGYSGD